jgi:hypothetical protein
MQVEWTEGQWDLEGNFDNKRTEDIPVELAVDRLRAMEVTDEKIVNQRIKTIRIVVGYKAFGEA